MKILKEGKIPEKTIKWYGAICRNCGTEIAFSEKESVCDGTTFGLKCPICDKNIAGELKYLQYAELGEGYEPNNDNTVWKAPSVLGQTLGAGIDLKQWEYSSSPYKMPAIGSQEYDCESCPVNPWKNNKGQMIVGDTPCTGCHKMMLTCTCKN